MNARKNKKTKLLLAAMLILFPVIALGIYYGLNPGATINPELGTLRTPFSVNYTGFDVHDGVTDQFVASVEPGRQYVDPTHTYPKIDVFKSGAFFVDPAGNYVETCPESYLEPYGTIAINGQIFYAHQLTYGFDFGVRTSGNMPLVQSYSSDLSPLWGFSTSSHTFQLDEPDGPYGHDWSARGVLTGYVAQSLSSATPYFQSGASITCMLEPIDIRIGSNPQDAVNTYDTAIQTLSTRYGNSKVNVYPKLSLDALPSFFTTSYDFSGTLDGEDLTYTVTPGGARVGISNVDKSWIHDQKGVIPNTLAQDLQDRGIQTTIPVNNDNVVTRDNDFEDDEYEEDYAFGTTGEILTGSVEYLGPNDDIVVTGFADPFGSISVNTTVPSSEFYLDETATNLINNYPSHVELAMGNTLQPLTTIKIANFRVTWDIGFVHTFYGITSHYEGVEDLQIPYGIIEENMYTVQRAIVSVIVLTENQITAVGPTGEPVDISYLTDYQLNQIIKDPNRDIFTRDANMKYLDWDEIWGTVGFTTFIVVAIVIVVTIIGVWLFFKIRGGSGGSSGPKPSTSWMLKLGKFKWGFKQGKK